MTDSRTYDRGETFWTLWIRQGGCCALCGQAMPASRWVVPHATLWRKKRATFDHVRPLSKGGRDEIANLQLAHAACNRRKGNAWRPHAAAPEAGRVP